MVVAESVAKMKEGTDVVPMSSGAQQPKAHFAFRTVNVTVREYFLVKGTSFNELGELL